MRLGIADHFGWAIAVTATDDHDVVDRRRIELVEPGVTQAPIHYDAKGLDDTALTELVASVRASLRRAASAALDDLPDGIASISLRELPTGFPTDIAVLRTSPWEARADAVMYREELVDVAESRGWAVHFYVAKDVIAQAADRLGTKAKHVLEGPRKRLGPPWSKDHRQALAATVLAD